MKNKIKFIVHYGKKDEITCDGSKLIYLHYSAPTEIIEMDTDKILFVGDYVSYNNFYTKIIYRQYCAQEDYFVFFGDDYYTGNKGD
jgi:hypothetical protein